MATNAIVRIQHPRRLCPLPNPYRTVGIVYVSVPGHLTLFIGSCKRGARAIFSLFIWGRALTHVTARWKLGGWEIYTGWQQRVALFGKDF